MVGDQIMMNEAETWCARMTNDYFQRTQFAHTASGTQPCATREKIFRLQKCARCGVLFSHTVAYMRIAIARERHLNYVLGLNTLVTL